MEANKAQQDSDKSTGVITMKIEKFSQFTNQKGKAGRRLSDPIYHRGLPWRILAKTKEHKYLKGLSYFLQCNAEDQDTNWGCRASAKLKLLAQKEGKKDHIPETINHTYYAEDNQWGFPKYMTFQVLMDPKNGWYDKSTDSIILSAEINADEPFEKQPEMSKDVGNLFDKGDKYSDCILVSSDEVEFKVYKGILACRSPVFAAMFEHGMVEAQNGIVQIEDIRSEVLEQLLRFIYSGKEPNMENIADELLSAADKYELLQLKKFCERKLVTSLDDENACGLLALADQHSAKLLKAEAIKYIQQNAEKVKQTEGWKMLLNGNYGELVDQIVAAIAGK